MISERERTLYFALSIGQLLMLAAAYALAYWAFDIVRSEWLQAPLAYLQLLAVMLLCMTAESITRPGKFRIDAGRLTRRLALPLARRQAAWILGSFALLVVLTRDEKISRLFLICFTAVAFFLLYYTNRYGRRWLQKYSPFESLRAKLITLIIGSDEWRDSIIQRIEKNRDFFDVLPRLPDRATSSESELVAAVERVSPDLLIFPARELSHDTSIALFALGDRRGFRCWVPVEMSRRHGRQFELQELGGIDVLTPPILPLAEPLNRALKRTMDIILGTAGVIFLTAPVSAIVFVLQRMRSPGPLFSKRPVVGQNGVVFEMLSFRTLKSGPGQAEQLPYSGAGYPREHGLDTIPRFINVLRGEMSIVGPPPFRLGQTVPISASVESYGVRQFVKPGMAGLSQLERHDVERGGDCCARRAARYDRFYAKHWSLNLDCWCVLTTIIKKLRRNRPAHSA